jgi:hypothetical protein
VLRDSGHPDRYLAKRSRATPAAHVPQQIARPVLRQRVCHRHAKLFLQNSQQSLSPEYYGVFNELEMQCVVPVWRRVKAAQRRTHPDQCSTAAALRAQLRGAVYDMVSEIKHVGSLLIGTAGFIGLPVSTAHIITSGIAGTILLSACSFYVLANPNF